MVSEVAALDPAQATIGRLSTLLLSLTLWGCDGAPAVATVPAPAAPSASDSASVASEASRFPAATRLVAVGDLHGDLRATRAALRLAGVIDSSDRWAGGATVLVQTGDVLDRGDDERRILELLEALAEQAKRAGGAVHVLQGNHELMNVAGDLRYVTAAGMKDFGEAPPSWAHPARGRTPVEAHGRLHAFLPGGPWAKRLASHPVVVIVGDTVFAHGGVLPRYAGQVDRINRQVESWLLGRSDAGAWVVRTPDSPVWARDYSDEPDARACAQLAEALAILSASRMVVGHTPQPGIRPACDGRVWRIDAGMAAHYGGRPQVLELTASGARALGAAEPDASGG